MLHFVISGKMLRHYLALICNLTNKIQGVGSLMSWSFLFFKKNLLIVA